MNGVLTLAGRWLCLLAVGIALTAAAVLASPAHAGTYNYWTGHVASQAGKDDQGRCVYRKWNRAFTSYSGGRVREVTYFCGGDTISILTGPDSVQWGPAGQFWGGVGVECWNMEYGPTSPLSMNMVCSTTVP